MKKLLLSVAALVVCQPVLASKQDHEIVETPKALVKRAQESSPLFNHASGLKMPSGLPQFTFDQDGLLCQKPLLANTQGYLNEYEADGTPKATAPARPNMLRAILFKGHIKQNLQSDELRNGYLRFVTHHVQDPAMFWSALDAYAMVILGTTRAYLRDERTALRQGLCSLLRNGVTDPLLSLMSPMNEIELDFHLERLAQEMIAYTDVIHALKPQGVFASEEEIYKKSILDAFLFSIMMSVSDVCRPALMTKFVSLYNKQGHRINTPHGVCFAARALMDTPNQNIAKDWLTTNLGVHGKAAREDEGSMHKKAYQDNMHTCMTLKSLAIHFSYLTEIYVSEQDQQRARDAVEMDLALRPTNANSVVNATEIYILLDKYKEAKDMITCYNSLNPRVKYIRNNHDEFMERLERYINHKRGEEEAAFEILHNRQKEIVAKTKQGRHAKYKRQRALQENLFFSPSVQEVLPPLPQPEVKEVSLSGVAPQPQNEIRLQTVSTTTPEVKDAFLPPKSVVSATKPTTPGDIKDDTQDPQGVRKKEKVKTRKVADLSRATKPVVQDKQLSDSDEEEFEHIPLEKILTGGAYKIVEKFFVALWGNVREDAVHITHTEVETVMEAIEAYFKAQEMSETLVIANYDASGGKGGHAKVTLRNEGMEREMVTLASRAYLIDYQIEQMRRLFLKGGYYPSYALDILKEKGYLDRSGRYIPTVKEEKKKEAIENRVSSSKKKEAKSKTDSGRRDHK
ncbi:MAG: hypothetical protein H2057_06350 [Alphaproteobacteria bacterium]|nr:hypothetical protein [Alphaproteobacteria bacterium]